jgi:hypothetical protein
MARRRIALALALVAALLASATPGLATAAPGAAAPPAATMEREPTRRHPLLPDQAKLQLAGALGLLAAGGGWALLDRRLELDLFLGWVPESLAGFQLVALTGKVTWLPWTISLDRRRLGNLALDGWRLRPFTLATAFTYTFGDRYFLRLPDHHPPGYYPLPTAVRATFATGGTLGRPLPPFAQAGIYWEMAAVDLPLAYWLANQRAVDASDVLSFALGARFEL